MMTLSQIVLKNLKYNSRRFTSFLFANSFVVAVLFMYGTLLFNDKLLNGVAMELASSLISYAAYATLAFSVIFISYVGIHFVKSRGKEFGVYLTLGMTTKDLIRMTIIENMIIVFVASLLGIITGVLFSKLFYLIIGKILMLPSDVFYIHPKTFLFCGAVILGIFLFNMIFTGLFITKMSIVEIIKSDKKKEISKARPVVGGMSLIFFIGVLSCLYLGRTTSVFDNISWIARMRQYEDILIPVFMVTLATSLYFIIASAIDFIIYTLKRVPRIYNHNLLILANLKHRFYAYKTSLFIITVLIGFAFYFIGYGISTYIFVDQNIENYIPYDVMIESTDTINTIQEKEIRDLVSQNNSTIAELKTVEYIVSEMYEEDNQMFKYSKNTNMIISESTFRHLMEQEINLKEDELLLLYNEEHALENSKGNKILVIDEMRKGRLVADAWAERLIPAQEFFSVINQEKTIYFGEDKIKMMYAPSINSYGDFEFDGTAMSVVDDLVYEKIQGAEKRTLYLFNIIEKSTGRLYEDILETLRNKNNEDDSLWQGETRFYEIRDTAETLHPIFKEQRYRDVFNISGLVFFSVMFLGMLFLVSSIVVLYYKIISDVEYEKQNICNLKKIGATSTDCHKYLNKQLGILFFVPIILGGSLGIFFVFISFSFSSLIRVMMWGVIIMYLLFLGIGILFYFITRRTFMEKIE